MFEKRLVSSKVIENHANGQDVCKYIKRRESCEEFPPFSDIPEEVGLNEMQCEALRNALGQGPDGRITEKNVDALSLTGLPDAFIFDIAGHDGRRPVRARIDVIKNAIFRPPEQIDLNLLRETKEIGPDAASTLPAIIDEIDFLTEHLQILNRKFAVAYPTMDTTRKANRAVRAMMDTIGSIAPQNNIAVCAIINVFNNNLYTYETRAEAARILGSMKAAGAYHSLQRAAWGWFLGIGKSWSDEVRVQSALAMYRITPNVQKPKTVNMLVEILNKRSEGSPEAAFALGEMRKGTEALIAILDNNEDKSISAILLREESVRALGKLKAEESIKQMEIILREEPMNTPLCRIAAWALGEIGSSEAIAPLRLALKNGAASVHGAAAEALLKIDKDIALEEIVTVMRMAGNDSSPLERMAAEDAGRILIDIGSPEAIDEVERTIEDLDINRDVRISLYKLLSFRTDRKVAEPEKA